MATYRKLDQSEKSQQSHLLLGRNVEDDDQSTSDDTTIVDPKWCRSNLEQGSSGTKRLLIISTVVTTNILIILIAIIWTALRLGASRTAISHPSSYPLDHPIPTVKDTHPSERPSTPVSVCGVTSHDAIAAGCHFNIFSFAWTPRECTDLQLYNDSLAVLDAQLEGAPAFYLRDPDSDDHQSSKSTPLAIAELLDYASGIPSRMSDRTEVLATWEHYLVSCTHAWQKVQRAAMRQWPLEEWSSSFALATRCGPDLLSREKKPSESIMLHMRPWFSRCGLEASDLRREIEETLSMKKG